MPEKKPATSSTLRSNYDSNYGNFRTDLYTAIRREAFGEDIGQNSWLSASEQEFFLPSLNLSPGRSLLDVACGSGGPALRIAQITGCSLVGVDVHQQAIATAASLAEQRGLAKRTSFQLADAAAVLPFPDATFDAITCIDAINHLPDRPRVLSDWFRVLRRGGRLLFTNTGTITGPLTNHEIAIRGSNGFFLFVPYGYDETILRQCGLRILAAENRTANMAEMAERRHAARAARSAEISQVEGPEAFAHQQEFLSVAARTAREGRLSRYLYIAEKLANAAIEGTSP